MNENVSKPEAPKTVADHKPDIRKSNTCPPLPHDAGFTDKLIYLLGIGLGSGLPKRAPGTWGTLAGLIVAIPLLRLGFTPFLYILMGSSIVGIWVCDHTSRLMNVHDDPHIVWDEWVGIWFTLLPMAFMISYMPELVSGLLYWLGLVLAFLLFRFFDIVKPNPIKWVDSKVSGGLGIMLDDILAGIIAMVAWGMIVASVITLNLV